MDVAIGWDLQGRTCSKRRQTWVCLFFCYWTYEMHVIMIIIWSYIMSYSIFCIIITRTNGSTTLTHLTQVCIRKIVSLFFPSYYFTV